MADRAKIVAAIIIPLCILIPSVFFGLRFLGASATADDSQVSTDRSIVDERYQTGFNRATQEHYNTGEMHVYSEDIAKQRTQNEFTINLVWTTGALVSVFVFGLLGLYLWYKSRKTPTQPPNPSTTA